MSDDETFDQVDAGASGTIPTSCGSLKKGSYAMLKGYPCKIMEITFAKTGKHGSSKASITGIDIFTNKKHEASISSSHSVGVPEVAKTEYQLISISEDGFLSIMDEDCNVREDLKLPTDEDSEEMVTRLKQEHRAGKELFLTVLSACGHEKVLSFKEENS